MYKDILQEKAYVNLQSHRNFAASVLQCRRSRCALTQPVLCSICNSCTCCMGRVREFWSQRMARKRDSAERTAIFFLRIEANQCERPTGNKEATRFTLSSMRSFLLKYQRTKRTKKSGQSSENQQFWGAVGYSRDRQYHFLFLAYVYHYLYSLPSRTKTFKNFGNNFSELRSHSTEFKALVFSNVSFRQETTA